jgi:predicted lipoprotein with Yx(FWY)xxD motif
MRGLEQTQIGVSCMRLYASALVATIAAAGLLAGCANTGELAGRAGGAQSAIHEAPLATPPGVTVQLAGNTSFTLIIGYAIGKGFSQVWAYSDTAGMTLYTSQLDREPGKSSCDGECAEKFPPFIASPGAAPVGDWSLITRDDGTAQWALRGKPLYTFSKDSKISDDYGKNVDGVWSIAQFTPSAGIEVPPGFGIREIADANGHVLVDVKGTALYTHDVGAQRGQAECASSDPCRGAWTPYAAPVLAMPRGDFSTVKRSDGTLQWAFKGLPLYTFDRDIETGFAYGMGVDKNVQIAIVVRYFRPPHVTFQPTPGQGIVLADENGLTLYRRDAYVYQLGGHGLRRGIEPRAVVGRDIGTSMAHCDFACQEVWAPFAAPADAQPSGHWTILTRDDGTKQWAYKSYALYRYAGDTEPGQLLGNDYYNFTVSDNPQVASTRPSRMTAGGAMYWMYAFP